eukprot:5011836-Pyramimonas_sp.AAC.1
MCQTLTSLGVSPKRQRLLHQRRRYGIEPVVLDLAVQPDYVVLTLVVLDSVVLVEIALVDSAVPDLVALDSVTLVIMLWLDSVVHELWSSTRSCWSSRYCL